MKPEDRITIFQANKLDEIRQCIGKALIELSKGRSYVGHAADWLEQAARAARDCESDIRRQREIRIFGK